MICRRRARSGAFSRQRRRTDEGSFRRRHVGLVALLAAGATALAVVLVGSAATLPGSVFEITIPGGTVGANLIVDTPGNLDWANVSENRRPTSRPGQGRLVPGRHQEDTVCPGEVDGSLPNNKSDLLTFGGYFEAEVDGPGFLTSSGRASTTRAARPLWTSSSTSTTACASGPNVIRTEGDVLLQFDVDQGGAQAHLSRRTWNGSSWGPATASPQAKPSARSTRSRSRPLTRTA